jgi:hypothetical protein
MNDNPLTSFMWLLIYGEMIGGGWSLFIPLAFTKERDVYQLGRFFLLLKRFTIAVEIRRFYATFFSR